MMRSQTPGRGVGASQRSDATAGGTRTGCQRLQFNSLEKSLSGPAEAGRDRGANEEPGGDGKDNPGATQRDRISEASAGDLKKSYEHTGGGTDQRYAMIEEFSV